MTLDIEKFVLGLETRNKQYQKIVEAAITKLKKKGITLDTIPEYSPPVHPKDIAGMPDVIVRNLYSRSSGWATYLRTQEIYHYLLEEAYTKEASETELEIRLSSDAATVKEREDEARSHDRVQELRANAFAEHAIRKILGAKADGQEGIAKVCSRDANYRTVEKEQTIRESNIAVRPRSTRILRNL